MAKRKEKTLGRERHRTHDADVRGMMLDWLEASIESMEGERATLGLEVIECERRIRALDKRISASRVELELLGKDR